MECIKLTEVIQAGDTFLLKYECPRCQTEDMSGFPFTRCGGCCADLRDTYIEEPPRHLLRMLAGSKRKYGPQKRTVRQLLEMQENTCAYCSNTLTDMHVEHIVPLSFGGSNLLSNLCLACPECNLIAGSKVFTSFAAKQEFILATRLRRKRA